jgi:hypothetical protein
METYDVPLYPTHRPITAWAEAREAKLREIRQQTTASERLAALRQLLHKD